MSSLENTAPDALYTEWFDRFQNLFASCKGDVAKIQLMSYIQDEALPSRAALGAIVSAAVLAMLD